MKITSIVTALFVLGLMINTNASEVKEAEALTAPSPKVQNLIKKFNLEVIDYKYTKKMIGKGTRKGAKALLIDARPNAKYVKGTIPSSLNIPDTEFDKYYVQIENIDKNKEVIVFCGGWKCGKSPKVASMLQKKGFTNVKLYQAGEPEWKKRYYSEVGTPIVKSVQKKNNAVLIDARPYKKYLQSTIPGAIAIPDTDMEQLLGKFPIDKNMKIITFCGGYDCGKSHKVAKKLLSLGYKDILVYAGGVPQWKKDGLSTTGSVAKKSDKTDVKKTTTVVNGIKLGSDEGTVDGEWLKKLILSDKVPSNIQIIDVTPSEDYKVAHVKDAINIYAETLSAEQLQDKLSKNKISVFYCASGARALEAWQKLKDAKVDVSKSFYFDANIACDKSNKCTIEVNEPLD